MPKDSAKYPDLIFSHGWGLQSPLYTATLEDIASHRYVVAAIDHPYDSAVTVFPDGHVAKFAQDMFDAAAKRPHGFIDYPYERIEVMATDSPLVIDELPGIQQKNQSELLGAIAGGSYRVMLFGLPGFTHRSFSDLPILAAGETGEKSEQALQNFKLTQLYLRGFLDKYLKGHKSTVLDSKKAPDARVRLDRFRGAAK
jgi:hypothetical protein